MAAAVLVLYSVLGFLVVPWVGKKILLDTIHKSLGREAELASLRFNPYTLALTARGFALLEQDGDDFVRFDELHVNLQTSSLFRWALTFKDVRLVAPYVHLEIGPDGGWNFSDLLPVPSVEDPVEQTEGSLIRLLVHNLVLDSGEVHFVDRTRPTPFDISLSPLNLEVQNMSTLTERDGPYSLRAVTGDGEVLEWTGTVALNPLRSAGRIHLGNLETRTLWRYIRDQVGFEIRKGTADVEAAYTVSLTDDGLALNLTETRVGVTDFRMGLTGEENDLASWLALEVSGASLDLARRLLHVPEVSLRGGGLRANRGPAGDIDWTRLVPAQAPPAGGEPSEETGTHAEGEATQAASRAPSPFQVLVDTVRVGDFGVTFVDGTTEPEAVLGVEALDLTVRNVSNTPGSSFDLEMSLRVCREGEVSVKGSVGIDPVEVKTSLEVGGFPLPCVQPYLNAVAGLDLDSGLFHLRGDLEYTPQETGPDLRFTGTAGVDSLETRDRRLGERFVAWESLLVSGIDAEVLPHRVRVDSVTLRAPYSKVVIAQDGSVNLADIFRTDDPAVDEAAPGTGSGKEASDRQDPMPLEIGSVKIERGSADFQDLSMTPQFAARIQDLDGEIRGLSSDNLSRADVALEGKVGGHGTVSVNGRINPISSDAFTDIDVVFRNVELTTLSPYAGKFAGYVIDEGKLFLDLKYRLASRKLQGENNIRLDRLEFGDGTNSPDAVNLPVKLAVALLKDVRGLIDVNLPVRGDLDDPKFSLGRVIVQALVNLVTRTVAAPFSLLGSLVGRDGEAMSRIAFATAATDLDAEEREKIEALAGALQQRPNLRLEVRGTFNPEQDGRAIRRARIEERLVRAWGKPTPPGEEEELLLLENLFTQQFGPADRVDLRERFEPVFPPSHTQKRPPEAGLVDFDRAGYRQALLDRLIAAQGLEEVELRQLAMDRALAVKDHLVHTGGVEDVRIFIQEARATTDHVEGRVPTHLTLSVR